MLFASDAVRPHWLNVSAYNLVGTFLDICNEGFKYFIFYRLFVCMHFLNMWFVIGLVMTSFTWAFLCHPRIEETFHPQPVLSGDED